MTKKYKESHNNIPSAVIVFDLDETLGYFSEFSLIWNYLQLKNNRSGNSRLNLQLCFNDFFDKFPELLRPLIIDILKSLMRKKDNYNFEIMLYTNNNGDKSWVQYIVKYLEYKINTNYKFDTQLFFKIIYAFKIKGKQVELKRTSHSKSYKDFLKTTSLPNKTQICFVDDTYYSEMDTDNVFYINIEPYNYYLNSIMIIQRLKTSKYFNNYYSHINEYDLQNFLTSKLKHKNMYNDKNKYEIDVVVSKTIWKFLNEFLLDFCNVK